MVAVMRRQPILSGDQPARHGRKEGDLAGAGDGGLGLHVDVVDRRANDALVLEGVGIFLAAALEPAHERRRRSRRRPAARPLPRSCRPARAPRRNRRASCRNPHPPGDGCPPSDSPSRYRASGCAATQSRTMPIAMVPGRNISPAGPAIRKPTATSCTAVFHLATRLTGTPTLSSARNSRRPETRISRHRMTIAAHSDQPWIVLVGDEHQQTGRHEELVGDGVEHPPERGLLRIGAGEIAVEVVGDRRGNEDCEREPARPLVLGPEQQRHHGRNGRKPGIGQDVRKVEGLRPAHG